MPQLNTQPTYTSVYASRHPSRSAAQNSRPSGSLLLTREALSSSTSYRFIPAHSLPSTGITRLHRYYEPLRHPKRPSLALTSCWLIPPADHRWGFPCCVWSPSCLHAVAITPAGPMGAIRSYPPIDIGLPRISGGSAPALPVSGPAQRLITLRPVRSPSRLRDPLHRRLQRLRHLPRCFDCYRVERTSSLTGFAPAVDQRLSRRTEILRLTPKGTRHLIQSMFDHLILSS
jgi:hypothetical protein